MKQRIEDDEKLEPGSFEPLSAALLLERGYCCGNGCKNCPYQYKNVPVNLRDYLLEKKRQENENKKSK